MCSRAPLGNALDRTVQQPRRPTKLTLSEFGGIGEAQGNPSYISAWWGYQLFSCTDSSHVLMFRVFLYFVRAKECTEQKTDANSTNPLKAARVLAHDVAPRVSRCSRKVNLPSRACLTLEHARLRHGAHPVQARWIKCCSPAT